MASAHVPVAVILEFRLDVLANFHTARTARVEFTTLGRVRRTGNIAVQYNAIAFVVRIGHRHGRQQSVSVRVHRLIENIAFTAQLDKTAEIHNAHSVRNMLNNAQIVSI